MKRLSVKMQLLLGYGFLVGVVIFMAVVCHNTIKEIRYVPDIEQYLHSADLTIIGVTVVALFVGITVGIRMIHYIQKQLTQLVDASRSLAKGNVNVKLQQTGYDEFGELVVEFQKMVDNIKEQVDAAQKMANGDLSISIVPNGENDILGHALSELLASNHKSISELREVAIQITSGSGQVASASQALAQGSTDQASALQQISASIDNIAERTKINASQANDANELVHTAKQEAMAGNEQMNEMICAMNEINEASENISKIIKVIDDISFQTNILALNAAVEAARAGSYGKGFAVVADAVRTLAEKSSSAASETAELIEDSIRKIETGSKFATQTAEALNMIVDSVDKIVDLTSSIASASNDQAAAIIEIDQALNQVSEIVQTNSATSEECAAASEEFSEQASKLRAQVSHFKLNPAYQTETNSKHSSAMCFESGNEKY